MNFHLLDGRRQDRSRHAEPGPGEGGKLWHHVNAAISKFQRVDRDDGNVNERREHGVARGAHDARRRLARRSARPGETPTWPPDHVRPCRRSRSPRRCSYTTRRGTILQWNGRPVIGASRPVAAE